MQLEQIMTHDVIGIDRHESVQQAARMMAEHDIGVLPVFNDGEPIGMVTDRDLVVRAIAGGAHPGQTPVESVMTPEPACVSQETETKDAAKLMEEREIRRLLVQDPEGHVVGIVSLGDLAVRVHDPALTSEVTECVSPPAEPAG